MSPLNNPCTSMYGPYLKIKIALTDKKHAMTFKKNFKSFQVLTHRIQGVIG